MIERRKIPIILISGFLGSGKTSLIGRLLSEYSSQMRIAVIQNEFAASSVDAHILSSSNSDFTLRELNTGSIFCSCLFSHFKEVVVELSQSGQIDLIVVEATGIADPIGIAQLLEDESVVRQCYLSRIVTIIDASRFLRGVNKIIGACHQVQVADVVLVSKIDLVDGATVQAVEAEIRLINPLATVLCGRYSDFDLQLILPNSAEPLALEHAISGGLTRCGAGGYISKIFKTTKAISRSNLNQFLDSLGDDILRLKGFVTNEEGECCVVQYLPGQIEIIPVKRAVVRNTELISIGFNAPDFNLLT